MKPLGCDRALGNHPVLVRHLRPHDDRVVGVLVVVVSGIVFARSSAYLSSCGRSEHSVRRPHVCLIVNTLDGAATRRILPVGGRTLASGRWPRRATQGDR